MVYVRQLNLPALKEYKYASVDRSLVSKYVLKPFYTNVVIRCFPLSMAPNLITLTGFSFVIANFLIMLWYNPTLDQDCPTWVYYSWAVGLFLYQTFDAVDGTQARRTKQSGPLGELFDHGVDALNTSLEVLFAASQNLGQGWKTVATLRIAPDLLRPNLGRVPYEDVDAGRRQRPRGGRADPHQRLRPHRLFRGRAYLAAELVAHPRSAPGAGDPLAGLRALLLRMVHGARRRRSRLQHHRVLHQRHQSATLPRRPLPGRARRPRTLLRDLGHGRRLPRPPHPTILHNHLVPFALFAGIVNAYSVGQIITAHLVKMPFPYWNVLVLPLALGVVDSLGPVLQRYVGLSWPSALGYGVYQVAFLFLMLGTSLGVYGSFVVDVVSICDYLDIWCLTIKHPYAETDAHGNSKTKNF